MSIYLKTEPIIPAWTDYNGHMNLAFYIHLFDQGLLPRRIELLTPFLPTVASTIEFRQIINYR